MSTTRHFGGKLLAFLCALRIFCWREKNEDR